MPIDPGAAIGGVQLRVSDLERSRAFYRDVLGFSDLGAQNDRAVMGIGPNPLLTLRGLTNAESRSPRSTGLYHVAYLVPDRPALGHALARVAAAGWPLQGAADHGVSEALYLGDPDGLGIEIYRDRPRDAWPREDGTLAMVTDPLDVQAIYDEAIAGDIPSAFPDGTRVGHVHLQAGNIEPSGAFYHGAIGLDVMQRMGRSALFVSAGGYHHHVAVNTWGVLNGPPASAAAPGLDHFELALPSAAALDATRTAMESSGVQIEADNGAWKARDPSGNTVRLVAA